MTIRIIDIETSGVDPATDGICEIASVDLHRYQVNHSGGGEPEIAYDITSEREDYVFPACGIPPESSAVHHIIDRDVVNSPRIEEVIGGYKTAKVYVAHQANFERSFLDRYLGEQKWICTFRCALRVWPDAPGHSNQVLRYWLGHAEPFGRARDTIAPHRAKSDTIVTACILVEMIKKGITSAQMLEWSALPPLHTKFNFGKYRGRPWLEIVREDPRYIEWIFKSELDDDAKWNARYWLEKSRSPAPAA